MDEQELLNKLEANKHTEGVRAFFSLLEIRYEQHKEKLVSRESEEIRGRAKECKELTKLLS